jgi:hypothetical protein
VTGKLFLFDDAYTNAEKAGREYGASESSSEIAVLEALWKRRHEPGHLSSNQTETILSNDRNLRQTTRLANCVQLSRRPGCGTGKTLTVMLLLPGVRSIPYGL